MMVEPSDFWINWKITGITWVHHDKNLFLGTVILETGIRETWCHRPVCWNHNLNTQLVRSGSTLWTGHQSVTAHTFTSQTTLHVFDLWEQTWMPRGRKIKLPPLKQDLSQKEVTGANHCTAWEITPQKELKDKYFGMLCQCEILQWCHIHFPLLSVPQASLHYLPYQWDFCLYIVCVTLIYFSSEVNLIRNPALLFVYCMTPPQMHQFKFWHPWLNLICRGDEELPKFFFLS